MVYVNIGVKPETKKILDNFKETYHASSYEDTIKEMAKANAFKSMLKLEGILKGCPEFKRDKRDRTFA